MTDTRIDLNRLAEDLRGRVITPADPDYDTARTVFYGGFDRRPAAVVRVADADDVSGVVRFAAEHGIELAVRSGGHSVAGHSVSDGGVVVDLGDMNRLDLDVTNRTAWAQTGLTAGEFTEAVGAHGLATGFGDTGAVGIGGITLAGGFGFLVRKHGLTIDNVLAAEVVTADGSILEVDNHSHPDLFWAIRGGGGNFGVVTRLKFRLHEVPSILGGMMILAATPETIAGVVAESAAASDDLSTIVGVMTAPPLPFLPPEIHGELVVMVQLAYSGDPLNGKTTVDRFRSLAEPLVDTVDEIPYPDLFFEPESEEEFHPIFHGANFFIDRFSEAEAVTALDHLQHSTAMMSVIQLRVLGGEFARVPEGATAFAHRDRAIMVTVGAMDMDPSASPTHDAWTRHTAAVLQQGDMDGYSGFIGDEGEEGVRRAYRLPTLQRLQEVKLRYDPENLFRLNLNITPARSGR